MRTKKLLRLAKELEKAKELELMKPPPPPPLPPVKLEKPPKPKKVEKEKIENLKPKNFKKGFRKALKDRLFSQRTYLIEMNYMNGTCSHHFLKTQAHKFNLDKKTYLIDEERKIYSNTTKVYMLRYHEGFALPYSAEISSMELKKALEGKGEDIKEITTSYNPSLLKDVLKFEYAKGVIQGAEVHAFIKRSLLIGIITFIAVIVHLAIAAYKSGWF